MKNTTNVFLKGMTSDMHPLTTSQLEYTDALNATLITFNGNEQMMQNDMGNTRIQDSKTGNIMGLREGFIPVGMEEHGGIMYIASVNKDGIGEVGTIPCPVIKYKPQDRKSVEKRIDFKWAKENDESNPILLFDENLNPEEIFIINIKNENCDELINSRKFTDVISSLTKRKLYIPHLIAKTSKSEKDITPTSALNMSMFNETEDNDYWIKFDNSDFSPVDLEVMNHPVEKSLENQDNNVNHVSFYSYPKIQPGKLLLKFTKENIDSFSLAPNGDSTKKGQAKKYPVLEYIEDSEGNREFYSTLYGVLYVSNSNVTVDKISIHWEIENSQEFGDVVWSKSSNSNELSEFSVYDDDNDNRILNDFDENQKIIKTLVNSNCDFIDESILNWPTSDTKIGTEFASEIPQGSFLYRIPLKDDYDKWITLTITYYYNEWDKPLGTYTIKYNPYYLDTLGQFITNKYWEPHKFELDGSTFDTVPLYRDYKPNNLESTIEVCKEEIYSGKYTYTPLDDHVEKYTCSDVNFHNNNNDLDRVFDRWYYKGTINNKKFSNDYGFPEEIDIYNVSSLPDGIQEPSTRIDLITVDPDTNTIYINNETGNSFKLKVTKELSSILEVLGYTFSFSLKDDGNNEETEDNNYFYFLNSEGEGKTSGDKISYTFKKTKAKERLEKDRDGDPATIKSIDLKMENSYFNWTYNLKFNEFSKKYPPMTTYLRLNVIAENTGSNLGGFDISIPISIKDDISLRHLIWLSTPGFTAGKSPGDLSASVYIYYKLNIFYYSDLGELLSLQEIPESVLRFDVSLWGGPDDKYPLFYRGTWLFYNEWRDLSIDFNGILTTYIEAPSDILDVASIKVLFLICDVKTALLKTYGSWGSKTRNITICADFPDINIKTKEIIQHLLVQYQSNSYVYPQMDAYVTIIEDGAEIEKPAHVYNKNGKEKWAISRIDTSKNYLSLTESSRIPGQGYTNQNELLKSSFNLKGLEDYFKFDYRGNNNCVSVPISSDNTESNPMYYILTNNDSSGLKLIVDKDTADEIEVNSGEILLMRYPGYILNSLYSNKIQNSASYGRSIGVYKLDVNNSEMNQLHFNNGKILLKEEEKENYLYNSIPLYDLLTLSVCCYSENGCIPDKNIKQVDYLVINNNINTKSVKMYKCTPTPALGYLSIYKKIYEYGENIWKEKNLKYECKDKEGIPLLFRITPTYTGNVFKNNPNFIFRYN